MDHKEPIQAVGNVVSLRLGHVLLGRFTLRERDRYAKTSLTLRVGSLGRAMVTSVSPCFSRLPVSPLTFSYFCVSLTVKLLAAQFKVDTKQITTAITLTLLFRSLGALVFGVLADRFGRKWTLVGNLLLIAVFELGSGFCNTYPQFLAVRSVLSPGLLTPS